MLFKPYQLKGISLPNRFMRSATCEGMADENGLVTDPLVKILSDLSAGGVGLIVTGHCYVRRDGKATWGMTGIDSNDCLPGLEKLVNTVHQSGPAKIVSQLNHAGRQVPDPLEPDETIAPSAVGQANITAMPRALEPAEIQELIDCYVQAAIRAKNAGFDGVQVHGAHGYLVSQFLSPLVNQRDDEYGGSLQNRARFLKEIVTGIRTAVGDDYLVMIKLGCCDQDENGLTLDEGIQVAQWLETWGFDAVEISGGIGVSSTRRKIRTREDEAYFLPQVEKFKESLSVPVMSVGGYRSKAVMEKVIEDKQADMVSLCRPLIREPDLLNRMAAGNKDKADCISCNQCMISLGRKEPVKCKFVD